MVHAVLLVDNSNIAKDEPAPAVQAWLSLDAMDALAIGHPVDDLDLRGRFAAAAERDLFECRIGGDDVVGHRVAHVLEKHERPIKKAFLAEFDDEQFGRDIVLIEDEALAHQLERQSGQKDEVWWVAG